MARILSNEEIKAFIYILVYVSIIINLIFLISSYILKNRKKEYKFDYSKCENCNNKRIKYCNNSSSSSKSKLIYEVSIYWFINLIVIFIILLFNINIISLVLLGIYTLCCVYPFFCYIFFQHNFKCFPYHHKNRVTVVNFMLINAFSLFIFWLMVFYLYL